jgi:hypothetical protein
MPNDLQAQDMRKAWRKYRNVTSTNQTKPTPLCTFVSVMARQAANCTDTSPLGHISCSGVQENVCLLQNQKFVACSLDFVLGHVTSHPMTPFNSRRFTVSTPTRLPSPPSLRVTSIHSSTFDGTSIISWRLWNVKLQRTYGSQINKILWNFNWETAW